MTNVNTMGRSAFFFKHILLYSVTMLSFICVCFRQIDGMTATESVWILYLSSVLCTALGVLVTYKHRRNNVSVLVNTVLPFEIWALIQWGDRFPEVTASALALAAAITGIFALAVMLKRINSEDIAGTLLKRLRHILLGSRTAATVCLLALVAFAGAYRFGFIEATIPHELSTVEECTVEDSLGTVVLLDEDRWETLNEEERVAVLKTVAQIEITDLGLNHGVFLESCDLQEGVAGCYNDEEKRVCIDSEYLMTARPETILKSVLHEMYHAYQHMAVRMYEDVRDEYGDMAMFDEVKKFSEEFENYISSGENIDLYRAQSVEITANEYAAAAIGKYYDAIAEYTGYAPW